jgi:hypothetical protein
MFHTTSLCTLYFEVSFEISIIGLHVGEHHKDVGRAVSAPRRRPVSIPKNDTCEQRHLERCY